MPVEHKAYVVTVDMGYGHQRAADPLHTFAALPPSITLPGKSAIISANTYPGVPAADRRRWEGGRGIYETISRMKKLPVIGKPIFGILDYFQRIEPFYPKRDLSRPTAQVKQIYSLIRRGWGKDLIDRLNEHPLPLVTTFFSTAFFAEEHDYKGEIYCLCTDTDISRAWVALDPSRSRIKYLAPNKRVCDRLQRYGIMRENIYITGFPLPKSLVGGRYNAEILKENLGCRIHKLDPRGVFQKKYSHTIETFVGRSYCKPSHRNLTITFAVGGAGAQREIGIEILQSLHKKIDAGEVTLNLVAGSRPDVRDYFMQEVHRLHLDKKHNGCVNIIYADQKYEYFHRFNTALHSTDLLWTKPSELSFYAGLGIPIIMAPTVGSQEDFNKQWLHSIGAGVEQEDPRYTHEWLFDWLDSGWLAQAALEGYMDAPRNGAYHIEDVVLHGKRSEIESTHLM